MDLSKIAVKIFAAQDDFAPDAFVPVFHRWIQTQAVKDHLLIDVADYGHVKAGPGTVLVSSQANIHLDRQDKRLGLSYWRKLPLSGSLSERLLAVLLETLRIAALLESEPALAGRLVFKTDEFSVKFNDRLQAPAIEQTFTALKPDIQSAAQWLFGSSHFTLEPHFAPHALFDVRLKSPSSARVTALLNRLAPTAALS